MADMLELMVFLVEDDDDWQQILRDNLRNKVAGIMTFRDGSSILELLKRLEKKSYPDVIVLDVMMPGKNGYQVCRELKSDDRFKNIPVILLTSVADHVTSTRYSHEGGMTTEADDYVPKNTEALSNLMWSIKRLTKK